MPSTCQDICTTAKRIADLEALVDALEAASPVEGSYTTWTIQGIYDTNVPFTMGTEDFLMIRNDGTVVFSDLTVKTTYIISPAGVLLATLTDEYYLKNSGNNEARCHFTRSLTGRYLLFISEDTDDLIVQEGTVERWRRDVHDDQGIYSINGQPLYGPALVAISPSGEWIVAMVYEGTNGLIFIYRGS